MNIFIDVKGQKLHVQNNYKNLVSGTQNFIKFTFNLDTDWDNLTTFAQFRQNNVAYNQFLDNENSVFLPTEIGAGTCTLILYGNGDVDGDVVRATTNYVTLSLDENLLVEDAESTEISQSLYDQLIIRINAIDSWSGQSLDDLLKTDKDLQQQINKRALITDLNEEKLRATRREEELGNAIVLKAEQKDVDKLALRLDEMSNDEVIAEAIGKAVQTEMKAYLDSGVLASMAIADGTISRQKVDSDFEETLAKADNSMPKNVYDPQGLELDIFTYARAKADTVQSDLDDVKAEIRDAYELTDTLKYDNLKDVIQGSVALSRTYMQALLKEYKAFTIKIVDELPAAGETMTFYLVPNKSKTGYDKYWWIKDIAGVDKWDVFGSSTTLVVDTLEGIVPDEDTDYILKANGGYLYYKYIDDDWRIVAGSLAYVAATLPDVENANEFTDYYIVNKDNGSYIHYRFINGDYRVIGGNSYTKEEINAKFNAVTSLEERMDTAEEKISTNSETITQVGNKVTSLQNQFENFNAGKDYDVSYDSDSGLFALLEDGNEKTTLIIKGGGGGGEVASSNMTMEKITSDPYIVLSDKEVKLQFNFTDVDGDGDTIAATAYVTVDGKTVISDIELMQGLNEIDITEHVNIGSQKVRVYCVDDYNSRRYKEWTVRIVEISISSSFNDKFSNVVGKNVAVPYVPIGNVVKTIHFLLNGRELSTLDTSSTGTTLSYSVPAQPHGSHLFEIYATATVGNTNVETSHVYKDIIWYDEESEKPIIGCYLRSDYYGTINVRQYDTVPIVYNVYDPKTSSPAVQIFVDGVRVSRGTLSDVQNTFRYKGETVGEHTVIIYVGDVVFNEDGSVNESQSRYDSKTIRFNVRELGIDVSPVSGNLEVDFNPVGKTNTSDDRLWSNGNYNMTVSDNFDWANGGYKEDENGDSYFLVKAGTTATFDYKMFDTTRTQTGIEQNATAHGAEMKLVFMTENVQDANAVWFTNVGSISSDEESSSKMGIQLSVHEGWLKTNNASDSGVMSDDGTESVAATNTYLYMPYSEEDIIELDINIDTIDRDDPSAKSFVMAYEDGVPSKAFVYDASDNFYQADPKPIVIGSPYCDVRIYRMKIYSTSLTTENIMKNFIADSRDSTTMLDRYDRNSIYYNKEKDEYTPYSSEGKLDPEKLAPVVPNVKILMLETDHFTTSKKTFVKANLRCIHAKGGKVYEGDPYYDNWYFENGWHSGQGTTSDNYGNASRNVDFLFNCDGVHKPSDKIKNPEADYISQVTLGYGTENSYTEKVTDWKGDTGKVALTRTSVPNNFFNLKVNNICPHS